jgi:hypothetical protein
MRLLLPVLFLAGNAVFAAEPGYDLSLGAEVRGGMLKVEPTISAAPGTKLRYEVSSIRTGRSGQSSSQQAGNVTVGPNGKAKLSQYSVNVGPQDRYEVKVQVYDGQRLVAAESLRHPE